MEIEAAGYQVLELEMRNLSLSSSQVQGVSFTSADCGAMSFDRFPICIAPLSVKKIRIMAARNSRNSDQGAFVGDDVDNRRFGFLPPAKDGPSEGYELFGSRHASAVNMCMCDGSCRSISYVVDRKVFHSLSNRIDGTLSVDF